jgi:hypothetical protein
MIYRGPITAPRESFLAKSSDVFGADLGFHLGLALHHNANFTSIPTFVSSAPLW